MNHRLNAQFHNYPPCPECNAFLGCPCADSRGHVVEPHRSRLKIVSGELLVVRTDAAREAKKLRAIRELVAVINNTERRRSQKRGAG